MHAYIGEELTRLIRDMKSSWGHNELLTKKELCERILRCDIKTAEMHIINKPNFPYIWVGDKKRYPKNQVEEWIATNTHKT